MAPLADETDHERDEDTHSQSPLLPTTTAQSAGPTSNNPKQRTSIRTVLASVLLLVFGLGLLYLAFGASYEGRKEGKDEDERWPVGTKVGYAGPTPTVRFLFVIHPTRATDPSQHLRRVSKRSLRLLHTRATTTRHLSILLKLPR
jgi:hypothetical protein